MELTRISGPELPGPEIAMRCIINKERRWGMTPQEMADLLKNYGTQQRTINKQITHRLYNVVVRDSNHQIVEREELVSLRKAREIKKEAHAMNCTADILEDWTIDCNDREVNPQPNTSKPAPAPRNTAMGTPKVPEKKDDLRTKQNMARAIDNVARSRKNVKCEYHMYRVVNRKMRIDIEDTQEKVAEFLKDQDMKLFTIFYVGIAESWGKEV
jgi:hypothetical protein